jgi:Bacterial Ig-like domain
VARRALPLLLIALVAASSGHAQNNARRLTTIEALRQFPGFYHLQSVLLRGELSDTAPRLQLSADGQQMRVILDEGVSVKTGAVEVRATLVDVGRLEPGDPRVGSFAEGRDADRWPRPGEELILRLSNVAEVPPAATTPTIRAITLEPWKYDTKPVTVIGNFRGRNLFGDLPGAPGKSKYDFVLRGTEGALWVTNLRPRGDKFELDINRRIDSDRWLEVTGIIVREKGLVSIDGTRLTLAKAPQVTDAPAESSAPAVPLQPVQVVFSSPTDGETDVTGTAVIRIQFSRGLNEPSLTSNVRVSYVGGPSQEPGAPVPSLPFQLSYDAANRAIQLRMAQPFQAFRTVRVQVLEGAKGFDGAPITPWAVTFTVGG